MRKLLVPMNGCADDDAMGSLDAPALSTALTLGRRLGAHVEVFCIEAEPESSKPDMAEWLPGSAMNDLLDLIAVENEKRRSIARAMFDDMVANSGCVLRSVPTPAKDCSVDFVEQAGSPGTTIARRGRVADLIITAKPAELRSAELPLLIKSALTETGRPMLISPPSAFPTVGERILVAWDGGEDASRAVALAKDLLCRSEVVTIVAVSEDGAVEPSADDLAEYLRWQAVDARPITQDRIASTVATTVLEHADKMDADLIVLGASLRSKLSRLLFGSVSAEILERARRPIFMAN